MAQKAMVIDLRKCVGCGVCGMACKAENNTQDPANGRSYNWANYLAITNGKYPDVHYTNYPVLCNHCSDPACIPVCPVTPKAVFKTADGITMNNNDRCIGCQACVVACPYSTKDIEADAVQYSVINLNVHDKEVHPFWKDSSEFLKDITSTGAEVVTKTGYLPPYGNDYAHADYNPVRPDGVVEKCIFCDHRLQNGDDPNCVVACPSGARTFGDVDDPASEVSKLLALYKARGLKNNQGEFLGSLEDGTQPNVYYIRDLTNPLVSVEEDIAKENALKVYPNPAVNYVNIETKLNNSGLLVLSLYDITGKEVLNVVKNEFKLAGSYKFKVNTSELKAGTYICRIKCGSDVQTSNIIIVR